MSKQAIAQTVTRVGFETNVNPSDLTIPRVVLLQPVSPTLDKNPNLRPGMIINNVTEEVLPEEFIPVFSWTQWIRFNARSESDPTFDPNHKPGELIWQSTNPDDPRVIEEGEFGAEGQRPLATKFLNFLCQFKDVEMPVVLSFSKSSFKTGKKLLSMAYWGGGNMFSGVYKLTSQKEKADEGATYYVYSVAKCGKPTDEEVEKSKEWHSMFKGIQQKVEHIETAE